MPPPLCSSCSASSPVATVLGLIWRGRRAASATRTRETCTRADVAGVKRLARGATLLQFSTEVCAPCAVDPHRARRHRRHAPGCQPRRPRRHPPPDLASQFRIMQTPTTLDPRRQGRRARPHRRRSPPGRPCRPSSTASSPPPSPSRTRSLDVDHREAHPRREARPGASTPAARGSAPASPPCCCSSSSLLGLIDAARRDSRRPRRRARVPALRRDHRAVRVGRLRGHAASPLRRALPSADPPAPRGRRPSSRTRCRRPSPRASASSSPSSGSFCTSRACRIGLVVAAAAAFIAAFLNSVFAYCLGCQIYLLLVRAGILGRKGAATA